MEEVQMKAVLKVLGVVSLLGVAMGGSSYLLGIKNCWNKLKPTISE